MNKMLQRALLRREVIEVKLDDDEEEEYNKNKRTAIRAAVIVQPLLNRRNFTESDNQIQTKYPACLAFKTKALQSGIWKIALAIKSDLKFHYNSNRFSTKYPIN